MSLALRWVTDAELDRVAETRARCFAHAAGEVDSFKENIRANPRSRGADFLLAEQGGVAVGTSTGLPMTMWLRGVPVVCQCVADVGTVKTHRRGRGAANAGAAGAGIGGAGIATQLMRETLRRARERGQVVSALMPFRASFYEHFGYGLVDHRHDWTVPLSILPTGSFDGMRFYEPGDVPELARCHQRTTERGQADIERTAAAWEWTLYRADDGFVTVDRPDPAGPVRGWVYARHAHEHGRDVLRVAEIGYEDHPALLRQLHFLASLRDQYAAAVLPLPGDLPLNRLLRETQLPHRPVNHPTAEVKPCTRLQLRVLDHQRLIEALHLPPDTRGGVTVAVHETEGHVTRLRLEVEAGRARVSLHAGDGQFECRDATWAAVVCGGLRASDAVALGIASTTSPGAAALLDVFSRGPLPYCREGF